MSSDEQDVRNLMNEYIGFAEDMLQKYGEFFPFGAVLKPNKETAFVAGYEGTDQPLSQDIIDLLNDGFRVGAASGEYEATALFYDTAITQPETGEKSDAVAVALDHQSGNSLVVFFPYALGGKAVFRRRRVSFGNPFSQAGTNDVFGGRT